jgi:hypothetical protein
VAVSIFPLHIRKAPSQSLSGFAFQAGHASSILVTRSAASSLVRRLIAAIVIIEHPASVSSVPKTCPKSGLHLFD